MAAAVCVMAAGCGSTKSHSSAGGVAGGAGGSNTITVGLITDVTGSAASGNKSSMQGVQAGIVRAAREGYHIKFVVGDSGTSPATVLSAAKKLVEVNHVAAVLSVSAVLAFGAAQYLTQQGVPVVGAAEDGPEWLTSKNMFGVYGALDPTKVPAYEGQLFKMLGATNIGALGYSISPSSSDAAKSAIISAEAAGLKGGYLNAQFPFGSTNVAPVALAMKAAGVDGVAAPIDSNTSFALIAALRQVGDPLKVALLATGYGGDLLQAGPGALQNAQNVYFYTSFEPVEMHTAATEQLESDLKAAGVTTEPTYAEYSGYTAVEMLVEGLKAAGSNPTHQALISALGTVTNWDAAGLFGAHPINPTVRPPTVGCVYVTKLSGSNFELVPNADPICGGNLPGKSV
jgi:ABC-type branched-subunit amino acid transport system substrate-binding protein